jgi:hypothetical protein
MTYEDPQHQQQPEQNEQQQIIYDDFEIYDDQTHQLVHHLNQLRL